MKRQEFRIPDAEMRSS